MVGAEGRGWLGWEDCAIRLVYAGVNIWWREGGEVRLRKYGIYENITGTVGEEHNM